MFKALLYCLMSQNISQSDLPNLCGDLAVRLHRRRLGPTGAGVGGNSFRPQSSCGETVVKNEEKTRPQWLLLWILTRDFSEGYEPHAFLKFAYHLAELGRSKVRYVVQLVPIAPFEQKWSRTTGGCHQQLFLGTC